MAELVDALVSGTSLRKVMGVRVPLWALHPALKGGVFAYIMAREDMSPLSAGGELWYFPAKGAFACTASILQSFP